ncbi:MAG: porin, partial [Verrucomicrobia bacterium]|nr:porin [Verrucomicrobiota bacterium]
MKVSCLFTAFTIFVGFAFPANAQDDLSEFAQLADVTDDAEAEAEAGGLADEDAVMYEDESFLDFIWTLPVIYQNEENPLIQEARVTGLYQWQTAEVEPRESKLKSARESETRRARIGGLIRTLYNVEIEGQVNLDGNDHFAYDGIDELTASYTTEAGTRLSVGKMRVPFSYEGATHSQALPVMERSLLVDQILPSKTTGVSLSGPIDDTNWSYFAGVFSGERSRE